MGIVQFEEMCCLRVGLNNLVFPHITFTGLKNSFFKF